MKKVKINQKKLNRLTKINEGACAIVYKYDTKTAIKVLKDNINGMYELKEFEKIVGIKNDTFVFPQKIVSINGEFSGYLMEYVDGYLLDNVISGIDINTLIESIKKVETDLKKISNDKIVIEDLNQGSLMYDRKTNRIRIIDTDFYTKQENAITEDCYAYNIKQFNTMIQMELGILNGQETNILRYLQSKLEYQALDKELLIQSLQGKSVTVIKYIEKALDIFEQDFGIRPNSFHEMSILLKEKYGTIEETENSKVIYFEERKKERISKKEVEEESKKISIKQKIIGLLNKVKGKVKKQKLLSENSESIYTGGLAKRGEYDYFRKRLQEIAGSKKDKYREIPSAVADKDKSKKIEAKMKEENGERDI